MRENFLKERHSGGLARHFACEKTFDQVANSYYWPGMRVQVKKFVKNCKIFQYAEGKKQNTGLYQPLPEHHSQWDKILAQVEFAYNDLVNKRIGKIPFQIMSGMNPRGVSKLRYLKQSEFISTGVEDFTA
jgi:hypothetical protein